MFERLKNMFRKGGASMGIIESLNEITDHPKISVDSAEYLRIQDNKRIYKNIFEQVKYLNSDGNYVKRDFHSLNVSKIIARKLSKLVFNDGCSISVDKEDGDEFLQKVFNSNKFRKNFGEELEAGYAIGGLVLRPYYDEAHDTIKIAYCRADTFYSLESNTNDISEAAIATVTQVVEGKQNIRYTLLEFHEWENGSYFIRNELYRSENENQVGVKVPLTSLSKYETLQEEVEMKGFTRPIFVYIKLAGKNNFDISSSLSLGIIDNAKRQLLDINEKYDQFMREIEEAGRKIIASEAFFKARYDKETGRPMMRFASDTSVFQTMKSEEPFINEFAPALRATEFIDSINFILRTIELETGFSSGTFSFDGQSVKTATEIISENSETFSTRSDNVLIVEEALKELVVTIFELANSYDLFDAPEKYGINIDFDDGVFQSQDAKADYYGKLTTMQLTSRKRVIQKIQGVTEDEADKILAEIKEEQAPNLSPTDASMYGGE
ncbi:Phage minor capsid protein [Lactococcus lactis subsp. lactis]|uniref:Capsid protein n=2 Tax=Lactococcus lactis TaxID=1358 RepID=A0A2A5S9E2_LACLH|nr:phage portal protein [Lactococcus lactis]KAA8703976.1 phage portal protein [Lactococcus lactis subsp. hordniae]KSU09206.1 Phage minor capsid protein [Lactococcus lactis subsp. lactis]MCT3135250.1 phage portal protein [Lactococcus lactis]PCS10051.1 capsid protein [Lactococcus lactis subsp. hordniae]